MDGATAAQMRERQQAVWSQGDWPDFATLIQPVAEEIAEAVGVGSGDALLDVATGSGNVAFAAARRGARVTGLDIVPDLVEAARARFAGERLEGEFVVGHAEELPFEDDSFDRVTSSFGAMFAPRQELAAAELARVVRPGGRIAVTAWTPEGLNGQMFATLGKHMPPPPEGFVPPVMWGVEEHVRGLFPGLEVSCEKRISTIEFPSLDGWMEYCEANLGPIVTAKAALEPQGKWEQVRADLHELEQRFNEADDGSMRVSAEYLLTLVDA